MTLRQAIRNGFLVVPRMGGLEARREYFEWCQDHARVYVAVLLGEEVDLLLASWESLGRNEEIPLRLFPTIRAFVEGLPKTDIEDFVFHFGSWAIWPHKLKHPALPAGRGVLAASELVKIFDRTSELHL